MKTFSMPCRDIEALKPLAQQACKLFLETCKAEKIDVFITQTIRTAEYQNQLYKQGRSKCDGYKAKSNHQGGMAWDIACHGPNLYDDSILAKAGAIAKRLGITWGGTWSSFVDKPHFEIKENWKASEGVDDEMVEKVQIKLNGVAKEVNAIKKDGNNYVKLQDLKDWKIDVTYDAINKMPIVEARA